MGTPDVLGTCEDFEEVQIGGERYNLFKGCPSAKTVTLILRGGAEQFIEEAERSLHDAIMIVRRALKNDAVVAGGGAIEMELSKYLREHSRTIAGKEQLIIAAFAEALVWEPAVVRINAITAASEAACLILSIDETVQNPKSDMSGDDNPITGKRGMQGSGVPGSGAPVIRR